MAKVNNFAVCLIYCVYFCINFNYFYSLNRSTVNSHKSSVFNYRSKVLCLVSVDFRQNIKL